MSAAKNRWWYAYGPFDEGEGNLPHLGQVIRYYRELRKWKTKDLAEALDQSIRHIYEIESSANMPELISRRQALSRLLRIPPILLGLSIVLPEDESIESFSEVVGTVRAIDPHTMDMYENVLKLSWELYYTSSAQMAASNIDHWLQVLTQMVKETRGIKRDQLIAMLCRFYQLSGVAARDRMDITRALRDGKKAVDLALQLENPELVSSSLFRRARTYLKQERFGQAVQDLEGALPYADKSRDPLRGYVYQTTAEVYSLVANEDKQIQKKSLIMLDQVGRIVRKGNLENDGSFVKLNTSGLYMDRARAMIKFGKAEDAFDALQIARTNLGPELTRWQARLLIAEAQCYLIEGEYDSSSQLALDALKIVRATQSRSNEAQIKSLYQQLKQYQQNDPLVSRLGIQLGFN